MQIGNQGGTSTANAPAGGHSAAGNGEVEARVPADNSRALQGNSEENSPQSDTGPEDSPQSTSSAGVDADSAHTGLGAEHARSGHIAISEASTSDANHDEASEDKPTPGMDILLESLSRLVLDSEAAEVPPVPVVQPVEPNPDADQGLVGDPADNVPPANQAQAAGELPPRTYVLALIWIGEPVARMLQLALDSNKQLCVLHAWFIAVV